MSEIGTVMVKVPPDHWFTEWTGFNIISESKPPPEDESDEKEQQYSFLFGTVIGLCSPLWLSLYLILKLEHCVARGH